MADTLRQILLFFGVGVCLLSSVGILVMRGTYDKLHYLAPISSLGAVAIAAAVVIEKGWSPVSVKVVLIVLLLLVSCPLLSHATARAEETRQQAESREEESR